MSALRRFQPLGSRFSGLVLTAWHWEQVQAGALTVVDTYFLTYSQSSLFDGGPAASWARSITFTSAAYLPP
jgi:hypothetical protein